MTQNEILTDLDIDAIIKAHYPEFTGVHPACTSVAMCTQQEFGRLVESIAEFGLGETLTRYKPDGTLLDGRTRLLACYVANQEIRVEDTEIDPWMIAKTKNIDRRHLSVGQIAMFGESRFTQERTEAKERQKRKSNSVVVTLPQQNGKSRDAVAQWLGIGGSSIDKASRVREYTPENAEKVQAGEMTLQAAYQVASKMKSAIESLPTDGTEKPSPETVVVVTCDGQTREVNKPAKTQFNKTNASVDWAAWTWNPVTGCNHGCEFCYARQIALSDRMEKFYPFGFSPTFHEHRLAAPANTPLPKNDVDRNRRVFVCSMADLFGKWVPKSWINAVFESCHESPDWEYIFLTKWPAKYATVNLVANAWYGATVTKQADVKRIEKGMAAIDRDDVVRWISLEPMLGPVRFNDLSWCDLMVIGSQTATRQPDGEVAAIAAPFDDVCDVVMQCRESRVPYFLKANLATNPGMVLPKGYPDK